MSRGSISQSISILRPILKAENLREALGVSAEVIAQHFPADRVLLALDYALGLNVGLLEWSLREVNPEDDERLLAISEMLRRSVCALGRTLLVQDAGESELLKDLAKDLIALDLQAFVAIPLCVAQVPSGLLLVSVAERGQHWDEEELAALETISELLSSVLSQHIALKTPSAAAPAPDLLQQSAFSFAHYDAQGKFTYANAAFQELSGLNPRALSGRHFRDVLSFMVSPEDREQVQRSYEEVLDGRESVENFRYRIRRPNSSDEWWVADTLQIVRDQHGEVGGLQSIAMDITGEHEAEQRLRGSEARYRRLVEHSDAIIFHADRSQAIRFVSRRALDFFGVAPEDFVAREPIYWFDLIHPEDRERVRAFTLEMQNTVASFDEEFRVINHVTGHVRWLLTRFMPVRAQSGELEGWDGFGIDITARREAQEALLVQSKKVRALYTVASAIRGYLEPGHIASRGLHALCDATGADAGICYLYTPRDSKVLSLVAHYGMASTVLETEAVREGLQRLGNHVADHGQSVVVPDMRTDPRAAGVLADEEGLRSAVLVPISVEDETLGALGLFSKSIARFDGGDVMLVSAAANQLGLAARQAHLFAAYRKQAKNLAALYRVSHELSRNLTLDDIFLQAFTIIRDELGVKRMWLGLLNETGTRLVGQAAYGPGLKRRLVEINVDITGQEHPMARVVRTRQPVALLNPEEALKDFSIRRIFARLGIHAVVLVPLVAGGHVHGVLAVQPTQGDAVLDEDSSSLLRSLANEIAAVLIAKRFEERIAESERMRTAGVLAAGIAHNFNNLLQAIIGQASLLEIQGSGNQKIGRAAQLINEAAMKGAALVRQLMTFAQIEKPQREHCDINFVVDNVIKGLGETLSASRELRLQLGRDLPLAYVDTGQLIQIVTSIVLNARDATVQGGVIEISTEYVVVDGKTQPFEVPLGDYIRVRVGDDGVGMDEETRRRCFEPFFTTKNVDPKSGIGMSGSGLSLAAAYALTRRNGGSISVESRPGQGSLFSVYVPVHEEGKNAPRDGITIHKDTLGKLAKSAQSKIEVQALPEATKSGDLEDSQGGATREVKRATRSKTHEADEATKV